VSTRIERDGPTEAALDKSSKPGDIEKVK